MTWSPTYKVLWGAGIRDSSGRAYVQSLRWPSPKMLGYKASWRPVLWRRDSWRTSTHWIRVRTALDACGLRLLATKTIIYPRSTTISGWIWTQGRLSTSTNKVSVLSRWCKLPDFALGLRSFIPRQNLDSKEIKSPSFQREMTIYRSLLMVLWASVE